jgi:hypothetical protein
VTNTTTVLVGVFEDEITAQTVRDELTDAGFRAEATTAEMLAGEAARGGAALRHDAHHDSATGGIVTFFRGLFGPDEAEANAVSYAAAVVRGGVAVTVTVDDDRIEEAVNILYRYGPVDIDQRVGRDAIRKIRSQRTGNEGRASLVGDEGFTTDFRKHFDSEYGNRGESWVSYEPTYSYGYQSANDAQFRKRGWNDSEAELRAGYERRNPNAEWEKIKSAVRYGFEKASAASHAGDDPDFQRHFHSNYEGRGLDWTVYAPAYRFGEQIARDPRYGAKSWEHVERQAKVEYLRQNPDSQWDTVKDAVRYAWEHTTGRP